MLQSFVDFRKIVNPLIKNKIIWKDSFPAFCFSDEFWHFMSIENVRTGCVMEVVRWTEVDRRRKIDSISFLLAWIASSGRTVSTEKHSSRRSNENAAWQLTRGALRSSETINTKKRLPVIAPKHLSQPFLTPWGFGSQRRPSYAVPVLRCISSVWSPIGRRSRSSLGRGQTTNFHQHQKQNSFMANDRAHTFSKSIKVYSL